MFNCAFWAAAERLYTNTHFDESRMNQMTVVRRASKLRILWIRTLFAALLAVLASTPAVAAVEVAFYSKELGASFPHAFVRVTGTIEASGEVVDASYGFTAKTISPAILLGSVAGEVVSSAPAYIAA